jgi:hypothetical protein
MNVAVFFSVCFVGVLFLAPGWWFAHSLSNDKGYDTGITGRAWGFFFMLLLTAGVIIAACVMGAR